MNLVVVQVSEEEKRVIRRLLELNAYEFSAITGEDIGPDGEYGYPYLDDYWALETDRAAAFWRRAIPVPYTETTDPTGTTQHFKITRRVSALGMGRNPAMSETNAPSGEQCPHCGTALVTGTADLADTPDTTEEVDLARAELRPGQMVTSSFCPTPGCPGPDNTAEV